MDTSGSSRRSALWITATIALAVLTAAVAVLAVAAARLSSRVAELETRVQRPTAVAPATAPDPERARLQERVAELERERDQMTEENRALRQALQGTSVPRPAPATAARVDMPVADEARSLRARGVVATAEGRYPEARWHLGRAVALDATDVQSWWLFSFASFATGAYRDAGEAFTRALRLGYRDLFGPQNAPALQFRTREEYDRHLRALEAYVGSNPSDFHARTLLAYHYYFEKGTNYAQTLLAEILQSPAGLDFEPAQQLSQQIDSRK